jgi:hypothetical protein
MVVRDMAEMAVRQRIYDFFIEFISMYLQVCLTLLREPDQR